MQSGVEVESFYVPQILSTAVIGALFFVTFKGADVALKVQNYVLGVLLLSVLALSSAV